MMDKIRPLFELIRTRSFIVITDRINSGKVDPASAEYYLETLEPVMEHLKQLARAYTMEKTKMESDENGRINSRTEKS